MGSNLFDEVDKSLKPYRDMVENIENSLKPYRDMVENIENSLKPYRDMSENMENLLKPYRDIVDNMSQFSKKYSKIWEDYSENLNKVLQQFSMPIFVFPKVGTNVSEVIDSFFSGIEKTIVLYVEDLKLVDLSVKDIQNLGLYYTEISKELWCVNLLYSCLNNSDSNNSNNSDSNNSNNSDSNDYFYNLDYLKSFDLNVFTSDSFYNDFKLLLNSSIKNGVDFCDKDKLSLAFTSYEEGNYYESIGLFLGLIDSLSIRRLRFLHKVGKLSSNYCSVVTELAALYAVFSTLKVNNFVSKDLCELWFEKEKLSKGKKEERIVSEIEKSLLSKDNLFRKNLNCLITSYCLLKSMHTLYDYSIWLNEKPMYFNRNWYSHGMYNIKDVSKIDCLKVIFIFYHLLWFYSMY